MNTKSDKTSVVAKESKTKPLPQSATDTFTEVRALTKESTTQLPRASIAGDLGILREPSINWAISHSETARKTPVNKINPLTIEAPPAVAGKKIKGVRAQRPAIIIKEILLNLATIF
jgi:hypothetical protein